MRRKITNDIWEQVKTAFASGIGLREIARNTVFHPEPFSRVRNVKVGHSKFSQQRLW